MRIPFSTIFRPDYRSNWSTRVRPAYNNSIFLFHILVFIHNRMKQLNIYMKTLAAWVSFFFCWYSIYLKMGTCQKETRHAQPTFASPWPTFLSTPSEYSIFCFKFPLIFFFLEVFKIYFFVGVRGCCSDSLLLFIFAAPKPKKLISLDGDQINQTPIKKNTSNANQFFSPPSESRVKKINRIRCREMVA